MSADQLEHDITLNPAEIAEARRHVIRALSNGPMVVEPFAHREIPGFFTEAVYAKLVAAMRAERFAPVNEIATTVGYEKRHVLQFDTHTRSSESRQPTFWQAFTRQLLFHPQVTTAFIEACAPHTVFGSGVRFAERPCRLTLHAIQDTGEYALPPHTDLCRKLGTLLVYLPDVSGSPGEGTVLYRPKDPNFICRHGQHHYNVAYFEACGTVVYEPNHAFLFARTERSFHGVRQLAPEGRRHLLQFTVQRLEVTDVYPELGRKC